MRLFGYLDALRPLVFLAALAVLLPHLPCFASGTDGKPLFQETFDTPVLRNTDLFDTRYGSVEVNRGKLNIYYSSAHQNEPGGIVCTLPAVPSTPEERKIVIDFLGGGTDMSNSLFISYAVADGGGLCLPSLPSRPSSNGRSGYMVRLIRHGDGTNEVKFYRMDDGWEKEIANDSNLPGNPVRSIRRLTIQHQISGRHLVQAIFDTGAAFTKSWSFVDDAYLPDNEHRQLHLALKGHAVAAVQLQLAVDALTVRDAANNPGLPPQKIRHVDDSSDMELLGKIELARGNLGLANRYLRKALENSGRHAADAGTGRILYDLATIHVSKDLREAENYYKLAWKSLSKFCGPYSLEVSKVLTGLAGLYTNQRKYSDAENMYGRAMENVERNMGNEDIEVARVLDAWAALYDAQGRYDKEEPLLKRSLGIKENTAGFDTLSIANDLQKLGFISQKRGRTADAALYIQRSARIKEKMLGREHPDVAKALSNLAVLYQNQGKYAEAERLYLRAILIHEKNLGAGHPFVAGDLYNLGSLYMSRKRLLEAESTFKRCLVIFEQTMGSEHANVAAVLEKMASLYHKMGDSAQSAYYSQRAANIRAKG